MRELKFRAWDKLDKEFAQNIDCLLDMRTSERVFVLDDENGQLIIEQYTGIKDKNGKEIYEGDVVKARWFRAKNARLDTRGEVKFNDGWFYIHDDPDGQDRLGAPIHNCYQMEVVGNIHENPELLEGEK